MTTYMLAACKFSVEKTREKVSNNTDKKVVFWWKNIHCQTAREMMSVSFWHGGRSLNTECIQDVRKKLFCSGRPSQQGDLTDCMAISLKTDLSFMCGGQQWLIWQYNVTTQSDIDLYPGLISLLFFYFNMKYVKIYVHLFFQCLVAFKEGAR